MSCDLVRKSRPVLTRPLYILVSLVQKKPVLRACLHSKKDPPVAPVRDFLIF